MWPSIGPIRTYGILYLVGMVLHFVIGWRVAKRHRLKRRVWIVASVCYCLGMTAGAKLLYDLRQGEVDLVALFRASHYLAGGLWGGPLAYLALAVPAVLLLARQRGDALDLVAVSTPVPWIAARLGCLLNGCCHGTPCSLPWALTFPEGASTAPPGVPVHPTQVYEMGIMLLLMVVFARLNSNRWRGTKLLWFLVIYGMGRAVTDTLRGDVERYAYLGPLTLTQWLCVAAVGIALIVLAFGQRRRPVAGSS